jgi:hypothetical protein
MLMNVLVEAAPELDERGLPIVAVWLGVTLNLPAGRVVPFLVCTRHLNSDGFLAEAAQDPARNEDATTVRCPHCRRPHEVLSIADAIEFDRLDVSEAVPALPVSDIVALLLQRPRAS